jgi:lipopolysaccharide export system protein LptC
VTIAIETGTHAWQATGRGDLPRMVRLARRHSAWVRVMRIGVPSFALAGLAIVLLLTWFNPLRALSALPKASGGKLVISGTKITMEAPKLRGFTRDNRAYDVTAEAAAQDFMKPDVIELSGIKARVEMQDKGVIDVKAVAGVYNSKTELLTLTQYILLTSSSGYEGHFTEAVLDVKKGHIVSEKPVEVLMLNGVINANRLEVMDNGALLRFDGGVAMTVKPAAGEADKKKATP